MPIIINGSGTIGGPATFTDNLTLGTSVLATPTGAAPSYPCRAWVNFNGTGTVAIRASGNVSSITDRGVAAFTVNFATAMPDANYAVSAITQTAATNQVITNIDVNVAMLSTACPIVTIDRSGSGVGVDPAVVTVSIFR